VGKGRKSMVNPEEYDGFERGVRWEGRLYTIAAGNG
jgi:hypothetical protein